MFNKLALVSKDLKGVGLKIWANIPNFCTLNLR